MYLTRCLRVHCTDNYQTAPLALTAAKEAIMKGLAEETVEEGLVHERSCYQRLLGTRDRMEALEAFSEKRKPVFKGE
jgi:methylglutaconyl-CoA hydratase